MKVHTPEQAKIIADTISQERDANGKLMGPIQYTADWVANLPTLEAKEKPMITIDVTPFDVKVTGFVYPLADLLDEMGFIAEHSVYHPKEMNESPAKMAQDVKEMAETYGWLVAWGSYSA